MKGFIASKQKEKQATYWIACYTKDNEDEPFGVTKKQITYKPGQNKDKLILTYCTKLMNINQTIWEILVHQGPSEIPGHGDQVTHRLSREKFWGSTTTI
jgi:hypothetical protein